MNDACNLHTVNVEIGECEPSPLQISALVLSGRALKLMKVLNRKEQQEFCNKNYFIYHLDGTELHLTDITQDASKGFKITL